MDKLNFTRKELYDLVWSIPMLSLSKEYNISDVGLRKICIRMSIPLPKAGHWQKLQFGKEVVKIPLPNNYKGEQEITLGVRNDNSSKDVHYQSVLPNLQKQIEENLKSKLNVPL